jgi:hypothetical protein
MCELKPLQTRKTFGRDEMRGSLETGFADRRPAISQHSTLQ